MGTNTNIGREVSKIPVAYLILGYENNRNTIIDFHRKAKTMINWVTDPIYTKVDSKIDWAFREITSAARRGVKCRKITEITNDNISHCKELMPKIDGLRHLEEIRGTFAVSDLEFIAMVPSLGSREEAYVQFMHSDSESMVSHKQLIFDTLWDRAIPAQSRISELEGAGRGGIATEQEIKKTLIDRIYSCIDCRQTFLYAWEVEEHKNNTGHENYRDFPLV